MSDEPKKDEQAPEVKTQPSGESLSESELEKVAGGTGAGAGRPMHGPFKVEK
jgi:hypothetical protein